MSTPHRVAVIGSGVAGLTVHNNRTYPTLLRLFAELGVATQESDMSMSVRSDDAGLEYAGALGLSGLFPTAANLRNPAYLRMLPEIPRFHRMAGALLARTDDEASTAPTDETFGEFLERGRFTAYFRRHFGEALVAAVWSCDPAIALDYPARYLFEFLQHHGMLRILGSPQWRTVTGCHWGATTPRRCGSGTTPSGRTTTGCATSASTRRSAGCGTSTSSTPGPASPRRTSTSSSSP